MKHRLKQPDMSGWSEDHIRQYREFDAARFPTLPRLRRPVTGQAYEVWPKGAITAAGQESCGFIRLGHENNLIISFSGGGLSVDEYTAARPSGLGFSGDTFYSVDTFPRQRFLGWGINGTDARNPFRDWNLLFVPYVTGDFHCGQGDFPYTDLAGNPALLRHHGYHNYRTLLAQIKRFVPAPDKLIITGFSAGAFGTALLSEDILKEFPDCRDITVIVDSALLHTDWPHLLKEVWRAPQEICTHVSGTDLTADCLSSLHAAYPDVKILFTCSAFDSGLTMWTGFLEDRTWDPTEACGRHFHKMLGEMVTRLNADNPEIGLFIFDPPDSVYAERHLTPHCITCLDTAYETYAGGFSCMDWMARGVAGELLKLGLEKLQ